MLQCHFGTARPETVRATTGNRQTIISDDRRPEHYTPQSSVLPYCIEPYLRAGRKRWTDPLRPRQQHTP
jgi:hypothetical protein